MSGESMAQEAAVAATHGTSTGHAQRLGQSAQLWLAGSFNSASSLFLLAACSLSACIFNTNYVPKAECKWRS
jgi:hypothetical protein